MANDMDAKGIGLSVKDILMGVVTVAAGATGGSAGAQGGQQLNKGLDGILGMAGVTQEPPPSRLNPEQADFAVRQTAIQKQTSGVQSVQVAQAPVQTPPVQAPVYRESVVQQPPPSRSGSRKPKGRRKKAQSQSPVPALRASTSALSWVSSRA